MPRLSIERIRLDGNTQPRVSLDESTIEQMTADLRAGQSLPKIEVCSNGRDYWLVDGFHRVEAMKRHGTIDADCIISDGDARVAFLRALEVNAGKALTPADRKACVDRMVNDAEWSKWSNSEIARRCGVERHSVAASRQHLGVSTKMPTSHKHKEKSTMPQKAEGGADVIPIRQPEQDDKPKTRKATRNGKTYEMKVGKIGNADTKKGKPKHLSVKAWSMMKHTAAAEDENQRRQLGRQTHSMQMRIARILADGEADTVASAAEAIAGGAPVDDWGRAYQAVMNLPPADRLRLCRTITEETASESVAG